MPNIHAITTTTGTLWVYSVNGNVSAYDWEVTVTQADIDAAVEQVRAGL